MEKKKKKKKRVNRGAKGTAFERKIVKELSLWWSDGERDDIFWRTDGSGSRATKRNKISITTSNSYGDIGFLDPIGKPFIDTFVIEIKRGYNDNLSVLNILDGGRNDPILLRWWRKISQEVRDCGRKYGMIIFQRDYRSICVCLSYDCFANYESWLDSWPIEDGLTIEITTEEESLVLVDYDLFFKWLQPDMFIK